MGLFGYDVPYIITYTDYCDHMFVIRVYEKKSRWYLGRALDKLYF